jgi:enoyl-CoA hydratase/carnithine racemase
MNGFTHAKDGQVLTVTMGDGENKIGSSALQSWNEMLDIVDADAGIGALVVVGTGKYWSTGLDLDEVEAMSTPDRMTFMRRLDLLLGKLLTAPVVTVAALNGHTYAGGALLALAFDYRVMRRDQGYFCLPSVDVGIAFSPGMSALIGAKLPKPIAHDLVISCRQIGGEEAEATGVVSKTADEDSVLREATSIAATYGGKQRDTLALVKRRLYPEATAMLTTDA